jgi:hypothetical protein
MDTPTFTSDVENPGTGGQTARLPYKFVYSESEGDLPKSTPAFTSPLADAAAPADRIVNMTYHPGPIRIMNATEIRPRHESEVHDEESGDDGGPIL